MLDESKIKLAENTIQAPDNLRVVGLVASYERKFLSRTG